MNANSYIKHYLISKNKKYNEFLKIYKKEFLSKRQLFLIAITHSINKIYKLNISSKNFKYLIGPWLDEFTKIYLLRKFHFKKINKKLTDPKIRTLLIGNDFSDFITYSNNIDFNLNFFSNFSKNNQKFKTKFTRRKKTFSLYYNLKFLIIRFLISLLITKQSTLLINSRFSKITILKLFFLSRFKVLPFFHYGQYNLNTNNKNIKSDKRKILLNELNKRIVSKEAKLIVDCLPLAYFENFNYFYNFSSKIFKKIPKNIFTTTAHLDDEVLKFSLLRWNKNIRPNILVSQHGGNYSVSNQFGLGYHDYEISKKYYTWGYKTRQKDVISNAQQIYDKVSTYKENKNLFKKKFLTFVLGPNIQKDFQRYVYQNVNYDYLFKNRYDFVKNYNEKNNILFKKYYIKRYPEQDDNKKIIKKIKIKKNQLTNDFKVIYKSKILIFDYLSTMFFEIINMNIPFIFILDEKNFYLSSTGKKLFNFLKRNNLLFKSGKKAAIFLNNIENFEIWWNNINKDDLNNIKTQVANIKFKNLHFWNQQFKI